METFGKRNKDNLLTGEPLDKYIQCSYFINNHNILIMIQLLGLLLLLGVVNWPLIQGVPCLPLMTAGIGFS